METVEVEETHPVVEDENVKAVVLGGRYFEDLVDDVHAAWKESYGFDGFVFRVGENSFIAHKDKKFWKIPYSRNGESVEIAPINEWMEVERKTDFVKKSVGSLALIKEVGENRVGAYGIIWGNRDNTDLHGEYFTPATEELTSVKDGMGAIPFLFHHGRDGLLKSTVIGQVDKMEADEIGLWFEARITEHNAYKRMVKPLMDQRMLFPSSGVLPAAKKVKKDGEITRWPIVEMTATTTPAEHRMLDVPIAQVNKYYKSAGLPELEKTDADDKGSEKERLQLELENQQAKLRLMEIQFSL